MFAPSRQQIISIAVLLAAALPTFAADLGSTTQPAHDTPAKVDVDTTTNMSQLKLLARHIRQLRFNQSGLGDVVDYLRDVSGVNIFVDWPELKKAGVSPDAPVTVKLEDVSLASGLDSLLTLVKNKADLTYFVSGGVIVITTAESAHNQILIETYVLPPPKNSQAEIDSLTEMIESTIDPQSWHDNGGATGSIKAYQGKLVVTATAQDQKGVALLILTLQNSQKT